MAVVTRTDRQQLPRSLSKTGQDKSAGSRATDTGDTECHVNLVVGLTWLWRQAESGAKMEMRAVGMGRDKGREYHKHFNGSPGQGSRWAQ
ncbi:hypothetical protein HJFPF1_08007 [Paramyrothecium foliicola]|nr:hypothetical protein HJFPF1_08007 [Paramyrothecium foliicola]